MIDVIDALKKISQGVQKKVQEENVIVCFSDYTLKNRFARIFMKTPYMYNMDSDLRRLNKILNNENVGKKIEKITKTRLLLSTNRAYLETCTNINDVKGYIADNKEYIEAVAYLKILEKCVRANNRKYTISILLSILSIIGGMTGGIIGALIGTSVAENNGLLTAIRLLLK